MVARRFIILGTGTGVGKSYAAALLVRGLRERGFRAVGLKPIESGVTEATRAESDAALLAAAGATKLAHCYAFADPISPHLAARRAGQEVSLDAVIAWVGAREEEEGAEVSVIEVAGGAFSPISARATNADLAQRLGAGAVPGDFILVGADALGVLHDVSASLLGLSLVRPEAPAFAVVLSEVRAPDASSGTNAEELRSVVFPRLGAAAPIFPEVFTVRAGSAKCESLVSAVVARLSI